MKRRAGALMLAVCTLLLTLMGCGSKEPEPSIVGEWVCTIDISNLVYQAMVVNVSYAAFKDRIKFADMHYDVNWTFDSDGTYRFEADEISTSEMLESAKKSLHEGFHDALEIILHSSGLDMTVEERLDELGMTEEEYFESLLNAVNFGQLIEETHSAGRYRLKKGKLILSPAVDLEPDEKLDETYDVTFSEDEVILNSQDERLGDLIYVLPFVLKRK